MMYIDKDELNIYDVESFHRDLLQEFKNPEVLIDMKNVNKIDISIIQLFISLHKSSQDSSKKFVLQNVNDELRFIFERAACTFLLGDADE